MQTLVVVHWYCLKRILIESFATLQRPLKTYVKVLCSEMELAVRGTTGVSLKAFVKGRVAELFLARSARILDQ
jgi:hypothetical protein